MDIGSVLQGLGVDVLVVLCIVFATQLVKKYAGAWIKPWLVIIPVVLGIAAGVVLSLEAGWVGAVRGGFIYGVIATWVYTFGTKFLGIAFPGDTPKSG